MQARPPFYVQHKYQTSNTHRRRTSTWHSSVVSLFVSPCGTAGIWVHPYSEEGLCTAKHNHILALTSGGNRSAIRDRMTVTMRTRSAGAVAVEAVRHIRHSTAHHIVHDKTRDITYAGWVGSAIRYERRTFPRPSSHRALSFLLSACITCMNIILTAVPWYILRFSTSYCAST